MKYLFIIILCIWNFRGSNSDCGQEYCPDGEPDMLNVHIVCHTHDDVGWLKTVDQYYFGANTSIQRAGVQYILDSVLDSLLKNPRRKFIYVETAFFWRWWEEQTDDVQNLMKKMITNGQLEFISGGWCMNDEGAAHYNAIIDQMTLGMKRLGETFGVCGVPRIGWQIDPFGHSAEQASIFAQMDFKGYFLGRIDYQDKTEREFTKQMEFVWKASGNIGKEGTIFTTVLPNTYSPPSGFCFDILCNDEPIMDDPRLEGYNVNERVEEFIKIITDEARNYRTNHIIMTMGNDFNYQYAESWFKNLDKLIYYVNQQQNQGSKINVFYSTPSCYLKAVLKKNETWKVKTDDFFPYASDPHAFWTGYFTSRPSVKGYFRLGNNVLQVGKQLLTNAGLTPKEDMELSALREALGVAQHHDAISGTAKQAVTNDYVKQVAKGIDSCQDVINKAYQKLMPIKNTTITDQIFCNYLNISECPVTENNNLVAVTLYNPIAKNISTYIRLPVLLSAYQVLDFQGNSIKSQLIPIPKQVIDIPGRKSNATHELIFNADLPPLGYSTYFLNKTNSSTLLKLQLSKTYIANENSLVKLLNSYTNFYYTHTNVGLPYITTKDGIELQVNQSYYWYRAMNGDNSKFNLRASGAYIFRPNGSEPHSLTPNASYRVYRGLLVEEIHQSFSSWLTQVIRLYKDKDHIEYDWVVGPIPIGDNVGKEVITRFNSNLATSSFYTDANGREIKKRVLNYRPTWNLNLSEPVSGNYYPINSRIYIKDENKDIQMTILNDRSQGGSSLKSGSVELMIHRRLLHDDAFGVGEPLNETGVDGKGLVVKGKHYLIVSDIKSAAMKHRELAERLFMAPLLSFAPITSEKEYMSNFHTRASFLSQSLPPNVHLLTLEPWKDQKILLRLEHMYEYNEDPVLSKPVTVSLNNLFKNFNLISIREMPLGGNQFFSDSIRSKWNLLDVFKNYPKREVGYWWKNSDKQFDIALKPMQIRTFELTVSR